MKYMSFAWELVLYVVLGSLAGFAAGGGLGLAFGAVLGFVVFMVFAFRRMQADTKDDADKGEDG